MKQNPDFVMCDVAGKHVLMPLARAAVNLDGMISLNEVGLTVWNSLAEEKSYEENCCSVTGSHHDYEHYVFHDCWSC